MSAARDRARLRVGGHARWRRLGRGRPRLIETADHDWLGIFSGDCNRVDGRRRRVARWRPLRVPHPERPPRGSVRLSSRTRCFASTSTHPPTIRDLRRTPRSSSPNSMGRQFGQLACCREDAPCGRNTLCRTGYGRPAPATPASSSTRRRVSHSDYFVVRVRSAPAGYTVTFSDGCSGAPTGNSSNLIQLGVGELHSCHVSFQPPRHGRN